MKVSLKKAIKVDGADLQKDEEGELIAVEKEENKGFFYLVTFKGKTVKIDADNCEICSRRT